MFVKLFIIKKVLIEDTYDNRKFINMVKKPTKY